MIKDSFMHQILIGSGHVLFHLNDTILTSLYALLTLEFDLPCSLTIARQGYSSAANKTTSVLASQDTNLVSQNADAGQS